MFDVPEIPCINNEICRPFWSVMIPTCGNSLYLRATISSVLAGIKDKEDDFQIAIIDNTPPGKKSNVQEQTSGLPNRFEVFTHDEFVSMGDNWNRCVMYSRGKYIHILHDDDMIAPDFYSEMRTLIESSPAKTGLFACMTSSIDQQGNVLQTWRLPEFLFSGRAGIIDFAQENYLSAPSVVIKRECYEKIGGFYPEFKFALDWEMYCRILRFYDIRVLKKPLAFYRWHETNATFAIQEKGIDIIEALAVIDDLRKDGVKFNWRLARLSRSNYAYLGYKKLKKNGKIQEALRRKEIFFKNTSLPERIIIYLRFFDFLRYFRIIVSMLPIR